MLHPFQEHPNLDSILQILTRTVSTVVTSVAILM